MAIRPLTLSLRGPQARGNLWEVSFNQNLPPIGAMRLPEGESPRRGKRGHPRVRPLWGLAMTDVIDGLHLGFDFLCHREEQSDAAIRLSAGSHLPRCTALPSRARACCCTAG